ncbi:MAG TPA: hypothetical protein VM223_05505 [Planctomycetota bacterium]|nr:hypothetical protein [Planctomycetota bacterium]
MHKLILAIVFFTALTAGLTWLQVATDAGHPPTISLYNAACELPFIGDLLR